MGKKNKKNKHIIPQCQNSYKKSYKQTHITGLIHTLLIKMRGIKLD